MGILKPKASEGARYIMVSLWDTQYYRQGIRIVDIDTLEENIWSVQEIGEHLLNGNAIRNLGLSITKKIVFTQGAKDRYPYIMWDTTVNGDALTVLGYYNKKDSSKVYVVSNLHGKIALLSEEELLKNQITNCKIIDKDNKKHIVSLSGDMDNLESRGGLRIWSDTEGFVKVYAKFTDISTVDIPESIEFKNKMFRGININSTQLAKTIEKLILPKSINTLDDVCLADLENLKQLIIKGRLDRIKTSAFAFVKNIEHIYIEDIGSDITIYGMSKLKTIKIGNKQAINKITVQNCNNFKGIV